MRVKMQVKLEVQDMFHFLMNHTYSSFGGYVGIILSICALIGFCYSLPNNSFPVTSKAALLVTALLFTVIQPIMLYGKAAKQIKHSDFFANPINYEFDSERLVISQGEERAEYAWEDVVKIAGTKRAVYIYMAGNRAFILPRSHMDGQYETLTDIMVKCSNVINIRLKK